MLMPVAIKKTEGNSRSLKLKFRCISLETDISQLEQDMIQPIVTSYHQDSSLAFPSVPGWTF